ncbi:MAG TPA: OB-fold domain-containing protein [Acidimicrobiales bacterium]
MPVVPVVDDRDTGGFFEAAAQGVLAIRRCAGCGAALHVPVPVCPYCQCGDGRWEPAGTTGTVYSWTVVEHQVHPAFPVPYTVLLVELDSVPGVRLVGRLDGRHSPGVGHPVRVRFDRADRVDGVVLPQWDLA